MQTAKPLGSSKLAQGCHSLNETTECSEQIAHIQVILGLHKGNICTYTISYLYTDLRKKNLKPQ